MADISAEITAFQSAVYGEDVRTALVSLANKVNNESSAAATIVGGYNDRLSAVEADGSVTTAKVADGSITTAKLADGGVTTAKLADGGVTTDKVADSSITTDKVADGSVTTAKVADGSITTPKLANSAVTTPKLADESVTTPKLANGMVIEDKLANGTVTQSKLANNAVTTPKIVNGSVTDDKLDPTGIISDVADLHTALNNLDVTIDPDDLSLYQDSETGLVYIMYRGECGSDGIPLSGGGGGGGGGGAGNNAIISVTNESGWLARTISTGAACNVTIDWSSTENDIPTGDGVMTITVGRTLKSIQTVLQGTIVVNIAPYLANGTNKVKVRITDVYDNSRTITYSVNCVELSISSVFDTSSAFAAGETVEYTYIPRGALEKTVHFVLDDTELSTETVTVSGRQQSKTLPAMTHGAHSLLVYFTATVDSQTISSNQLYYELVVVSPSSESPIIASPYTNTTATQYDMLEIPYTVYTPGSLTSTIQLIVNETTANEIVVGRTEQTWMYRCINTGTLELSIKTGNVTKTFTLSVTESDIDVNAETQNLSLYLTSYGRSNGEISPSSWADTDNNINCTLTGFNYVSNGWVSDSDGQTVLRVNNGASVTVPYMPFASDFRSTGKTIEVEFAVRDVLDYDAAALTCMSDGRGFSLTAQFATLASEQTTVMTQYKEDEHVRVSFVAQKRTEDRLLLIYINGIMSGCVQYPSDDDFSQQTPVNITIGDDGITTDIYCIRIYDNDLTRYQILDNWIADTSDAGLMLERYNHNDIYDAYGDIVIDKLPTDLPYMVIEAAELPAYKGDKKTVSGYYVDPVDTSNSFTFTGCQMNVQGTSSAPYYRKNWDLQFKQGFEMENGQHADTFALAPTVIPFNRFVLKADVASSEGANNVELVKLYNDADPYTRPEREEDPKVRDGIYGFPIVMFWHDTVNDEIKFYSKMNFNLPKRAPEPYGYSGNMESWEFQNNTSNLLLFKTNYFDETMQADPSTGESKEKWRYDYEARFPSDEWVDYSKLQELETFIYSTYRAEATGNALTQSVTYEGVTYTTDTSAYRLAKFRNEFGKYAEINSFLFYYIFTELFLMVDSRAKNLFVGFSGSTATGLSVIDRKAVAEPYDMDTAIGINNEGSLAFGYSLEDVDTVSGANVFNGQDSVLWCNIRDAFSSEIASMYQRLRSEGTISYANVMQRFTEHQSKWPEALFNEDATVKYIEPLVDPQGGKEPTDVYLPMLQGSKAEQRKWWLYNRFRYMDSKWLAGDATANRIQLRGYAKADITVTPYADIYPTVQYGSYYVSQRGQHGISTTLACPLDSVNDTEIYIYSANELKSVGDLSGLKVGFADFSQANKLVSIQVGSNALGYENPNLATLSVGTNRFLSTVDARNCSALTGTVDLSGAANIEYVYMEGTAVTSVSLPVGGILKTLQLPDTVTNLTIRNQGALTSFSVDGSDYTSITTLRVENSTAVPVIDILGDMSAASRVRIIGFTTTASTTSDVEDFCDYLDTMRGLDESGNNLETAVASGTITGLDTITGSWLASILARYPNLTITYSHITSNLYYYNYDGTTLLYTETVTDGGNGSWSGSSTRTATAQYSYTFIGWSRQTDQTSADATATQAVTADRTVYAAFSRVVQTYTVTWKNYDNTTLETDTNVPYGTMPSYDGAIPTKDGQTANGWSPQVTVVTGDMTYTAVYLPAYTVKFYNGSTILQTSTVVQGQDAVYTGSTPQGSESYLIFTGWDKPLTNIQADTDIYAQFNDPRSPVVKYVERGLTNYESNTATTVAPYAFYYDSSLVTATTSATSIGVHAFYNCSSLTTVDLTNTNATSIGATAFNSCPNLDALIIDSTTKSTLSGNSYDHINGTKISKYAGAIYVPSNLVLSYLSDQKWCAYPIASIDSYPATDFSTISDSWDDIIGYATAGTAAQRYSIGDVKSLNLGDYGVVYMQIVGFGVDTLADDTTQNAAITFIGKSLPNNLRLTSGTYWNTIRMNPAESSGTQGTGANGGWEHSELRSFMANTMFNSIPSNVASAIKSVVKYSGTIIPGETTVTKDSVTSDKLWIPSYREVFGLNDAETKGQQYTFLRNTVPRTSSWWLRSAYSKTHFRAITSSYSYSSGSSDATVNRALVLGFCI